jgi:N-methylhydantoinase A
MIEMPQEVLRVAVDTGGTFTDFVVVKGEDLQIFKVPSTPEEPASALLRGLERVGAGKKDFLLLHGTTVATNAILEGKTARTAFVTNEGFKDLLFLARQTRPNLYDWEPLLPQPPLSPEDCYTIRGRLLPDGRELIPLDETALPELQRKLQGYESVAICLLYSYANPSHERRIAGALQNAFLSLSSEVSPEFREYERAMTTCLNGSVGPLMQRYLREIGERSQARSTYLMSSSGGLIPVEKALGLPILSVTSGPAGGVSAGEWLARQLGYERVITLDMGGTSTDVSLIHRKKAFTSLSQIAGLPLRLHRVDIHTIGCGGGSEVWLDPVGALHVGPQSAGAYPGPALYGHGGPFTVTDAHFVLGRLPTAMFAGGSGPRLDLAAPLRKASELGGLLGRDPRVIASSAVDSAEAQMMRAIRRVSSERGYDPADFALIPFGGAAGLHACAMAEGLGIKEIIVPATPGVFSAWGLLVAPMVSERSVSVLGQVEPGDWGRVYSDLEEKVRSEGGFSSGRALFLAEMRYRGQSYELALVVGERSPESSFFRSYEEACADFEEMHENIYGVRREGIPIQWVTARVRLEVPMPPCAVARIAPGASGTPLGEQEVYWQGRWMRFSLWTREEVARRGRIQGPALIIQADATFLLAPGWKGEDADGLALIVRAES